MRQTPVRPVCATCATCARGACGGGFDAAAGAIDLRGELVERGGLGPPFLFTFDQAQFRGDFAAQHDVIDAALDAQRLEVDRGNACLPVGVILFQTRRAFRGQIDGIAAEQRLAIVAVAIDQIAQFALRAARRSSGIRLGSQFLSAQHRRARE